MNSFQSLKLWNDYFGRPHGSMLGLLNAIQVSRNSAVAGSYPPLTSVRCQNIGSLAAYPFAPYLSDGIGRRLTVFIGATIMLAAVGIQTGASNLNMFIAAR